MGFNVVTRFCCCCGQHESEHKSHLKSEPELLSKMLKRSRNIESKSIGNKSG